MHLYIELCVCVWVKFHRLPANASTFIYKYIYIYMHVSTCAIYFVWFRQLWLWLDSMTPIYSIHTHTHTHIYIYIYTHLFAVFSQLKFRAMKQKNYNYYVIIWFGLICLYQTCASLRDSVQNKNMKQYRTVCVQFNSFHIHDSGIINFTCSFQRLHINLCS